MKAASNLDFTAFLQLHSGLKSLLPAVIIRPLSRRVSLRLGWMLHLAGKASEAVADSFCETRTTPLVYSSRLKESQNGRR